MPPRSHLSQRRLKRERAITTAKPWCAAQSLQPASSSSRDLNSLAGIGARERGGGGEAPGEIGMHSRSGVLGRKTPNMVVDHLQSAVSRIEADTKTVVDNVPVLSWTSVCGVRVCVT